jgi:hypothetical protein
MIFNRQLAISCRTPQSTAAALSQPDVRNSLQTHKVLTCSMILYVLAIKLNHNFFSSKARNPLKEHAS